MNRLVDKYGENPFCLSEFIKQSMEFYRSTGWTPIVLVMSADKKIVGIAPLIIKKRFGVRFARFVGRSWFSPDFIIEDQYRENFIKHLIDFLFRILRCHFVELILPAESPNLQILKYVCIHKVKITDFYTKPAVGHCVIPVECTWDEFKASRGRNFRRKFKKIERHLDQAGSWRITCVENADEGSDVFKRILDVEKRSWKERWRTRKGIEIDPDLLMLWKAAQYTTTVPDFKWTVWFLELNGQTLAYCFFLRYKGIAFDVKTSYDARYKRFYPGVYVNNAAIRELFDKKQVRNIDFLSDLAFHRTWTSICLPRVKVIMSRKGVPSIIARASPKLVEFLRMMRPRQLKGTQGFF